MKVKNKHECLEQANWWMIKTNMTAIKINWWIKNNHWWMMGTTANEY